MYSITASKLGAVSTFYFQTEAEAIQAETAMPEAGYTILVMTSKVKGL